MYYGNLMMVVAFRQIASRNTVIFMLACLAGSYFYTLIEAKEDHFFFLYLSITAIHVDVDPSLAN